MHAGCISVEGVHQNFGWVRFSGWENDFTNEEALKFGVIFQKLSLNLFKI